MNLRFAATPSPPLEASGTPKTEAAIPAAAAESAPSMLGAPALPATVRQLMLLRTVAIVGQSAAIAVALRLRIDIRTEAMLAVVGALIALNAFASVRLMRGTRPTIAEVAVYLALDLAAFTALLLGAGGIANPFSLVYLLHVVLFAMLLPGPLAFVGTLAVLGNVALALVRAEPLHHLDGRLLSDGWMAAGVGISFTVTTVTIAWFVVRIVTSLREHEMLLREAARRALNDEMVLRMGTLAAGAAHELGTPLTTIAVVVADMVRDANTDERRREAAILSDQIDACRHALANLRAAAGHASVAGGRERLDEFIASIIARFRAMRPNVVLAVSRDGPLPAPEIFADTSLQQAILVLLNNAADASPNRVNVDVRWSVRSLELEVGDRGSGVAAGSVAKLGRDFFTTKPQGQGTGLGLVLTAFTVARLGGTVRWLNRTGGGLSARIELPLARLDLGASTQ